MAALDVERNWAASMRESLQSFVARRRRSGAQEAFDASHVPSTPPPPAEPAAHGDGPPREPVHLPTEIIVEILSHIPRTHSSQATLHSCCLLSRQWYSVAVGRLYERPLLYGGNFDPFVRTICPSINAHVRRSALAELVRVLDLGGLVHHGSRSVTARLLGRTKAGLESFTAPQASFAINCFAALSKCGRLAELDLSLISESISLHSLAHALRALPRLRTLRFPRSSHHDGDGFRAEQLRWPPRLASLALAGGVGDRFLLGLAREPANLPDSLRHLVVQHCPHVSHRALRELLRPLAPRLRALRVAHLPAFPAAAMDRVLGLCPALETLSVAADYVTDGFAVPPKPGDASSSSATTTAHPLRNLEITDSGHPNLDENRLRPIDLYIAVEDGFLAGLRLVRVAASVGWGADDLAAEASALADLLRKTAAEAGEAAGDDVGVFVFDA